MILLRVYIWKRGGIWHNASEGGGGDFAALLAIGGANWLLATHKAAVLVPVSVSPWGYF